MPELAPTWWVLLAPFPLLALGWFVAALHGVSAGQSGAWSEPLRGSARLLVQGRRVTSGPDLLLWRVGLLGPVVVAVLLFLQVPWGDRLLSDPPVGVVWLNALDVMLWALWWLAGWGPNAVHPLVGGYRFLAQALSYELPLMFVLTAPAVAAQSLRISEVVAAQQDTWFVVQMPLAFLLYLVSVAGYATWGPLSSPAGRDLSGGVLAELSGPDRLLVSTGRVLLLTAGSALAVPLFLGGGSGPLLPAALWSLLKATAVLAAVVVVSSRLPVVRPERLAPLAFLVLLPLSLAQLLVVSLLQL